MLQILEDRYGKTGLIITVQQPVNKWHDVIGVPTAVDSIFHRLLSNAHRIELKGLLFQCQREGKNIYGKGDVADKGNSIAITKL